MDVIMLSRLQFAAATFFHFLFVPLTLGLSILIAIMETIYAKSGDEEYRRMARFWGKIFLVNFAVGVVTGITLEFQFGTNWSRYSSFVGGHFRFAAGRGGHGCFLPGIHLHRGLGVRLEPTFAQDARRGHLAGGGGFQHQRLLDFGGQLFYAAPGGLCDAKRPGRT